MGIDKRITVLAAGLFIFTYTARTVFAVDLPSTTITITKNQVRSSSPHTVSTFQPSVDLGVIAGLTQSTLDKYMDSLCGTSQGYSGGGLDTVNQVFSNITSNIISAITPPAIGSSSQNQLGPATTYSHSQSTVSLTPEQVASMQQQGGVLVLSTSSPSPLGTPTLTISAPATTTTTPAQTTAGGSGDATVLPASTSPNVVVLSTGASTGTGQVQVGVSQPTISVQAASLGNTNQLTYLPGFTFSLPLAIVLDTFWAPVPNAVTKAKLKVIWNISQADLNEFNRRRATGTLVPFSSMGSVSMKTEKFEFRREVGARADVGLSVQWEGSLRKLASVQLTDIAIEINDPSSKNNNVNDPLSAQYLRHSDSVFVSDVAKKIIEAIGGKANIAGKIAGDTSLGRKILGKIVGELGVKVQVVQSTLNRKAQASFKATGKDFSGKAIPLEVASPITFESDNREYPVNITFPNDCPPLKEITLKPIDATYSFEEHGYPELVVTGFGQELPTGPLLERAGLFTEASHTMTDWTSTGSDMKIAVPQKPVIYPIRGNITVGNPPGGVQGVQVRVFTRNVTTGHESVFNTVDSNPAGDFVADICLFVTGNAQPVPPPYIIEVSKPEYQTITSTGNPDRFIKTKDNPLTYRINLPLPANQVLAVLGKILDNTNQGVPQAEVLLHCAGVEYQAISDASGAYQFPSVLFGSTVQLYANKAGLYFNPESRNVSSGTKTITVDLKSSIDRRWGDAKFNFSAESGSLPASVKVLRSSLGGSFSIVIPADGVAQLAVLGSNRETFTFSKDDYTVTPESVTVEFSENDTYFPTSANTPVVPIREFNIVVSSRIPSAATLSADKASIERFGSFYNPAGEKEKAVLTTKVVDSAGRPVGGANVRFEISGAAVKILKEGTRPQGAGPTSAYAQTDSAGNAQVTICSMRDLGVVNITAAAYYGDIVSNLRSNGYALTIVENTRPERAGKPTCSMTAEVGNLGLSGPGVRIAKGGDILFHLNYSTNSQLGSLTGYKFLYSKDNGPADEELFNTSPHPVARKTFNEAGIYNVQYMVKRTFDGTDTWSDPAQVTFTVVAYEPPRATLTLPRTTGTVNLPLDYSFTGEVSAPFKQMLITFGDNQGTIDLDAGLLNGKYFWSGTFYHTYTSEGTYQIKLKVTDQSNAFKEEIKQVTIGSVAQLNDTTAPAGSISINSGAASTTGKSALIHAVATDDISGVYRMRYSNNGSNWSDWNSVAIDDRSYLSIVKDRVWELTDGAGTKTVYVQFKDAANNISQTITDTIELQAAGLQVSGALPAPQVTVTGYQGAPMPRGSIAITSRSGNNISVVFSATNDWAIFVNQMALSFDNQSWASWMPFEPNKQISLDGHLDAAKIYVIFADAAGGQSPAYSANIPAASTATAPAAQVATTQAVATTEADSVKQAAVSSRENKLAVRQTTDTANALGSGAVAQGVEQANINRVAKRLTNQRQQTVVVVNPEVIEKKPIDPEVFDLRAPREIIIGQNSEFEVIVKNNSESEIREVVVNFETEDGFNDRKVIPLRPRSQERIRFSWVPRKEGRQKISATLECREDSNPANNQKSEVIEVKGKEPVDISLLDMRQLREITVGQSCDIEVIIKNSSDSDIRECQLNFECEDGYRDTKRLSLRPQAQERIRFSWVPRKEGRQKITASLESREDTNPRNNSITQAVEVKPVAGAGELIGRGKEEGLQGIILKEERRRREEKFPGIIPEEERR